MVNFENRIVEYKDVFEKPVAVGKWSGGFQGHS
jgi:hypothetical protein